MSEKMYPIPFKSLMNWVVEEYAASGEIFGVRKAYHATGKSLPIFGERIETPFGPAAGPNSQLAQNIIAAYMAGARFFEVKTVQKMDGADLAACVPRPCILAADEGYNQEWSTELTVAQAQDEYIKAWCALKVISKVYGLGDPDGFVFNMSVGYDLEGIKSPKVDAYIEGMKDASGSDVWNECRAWALANLDKFEHVDAAFVESIPARISNSITESTLHGCPPAEIERIATYLITEKGLNTYIKCNPTLLGYEFARQRLNELGFDYIVFDDTHFREDLQWADAVPMFERLIALCAERGLEFGVKLTNTFPVDVTRNELPSTEMYMSGRSLFSLTIEAARRITEQFDGKLRISYSGGATVYNIRALYDAGIWPVTLATDVLKPGGYERFSQMAGEFTDLDGKPFAGVSLEAVTAIQADSLTNPLYKKPLRPLPDRKVAGKSPLSDCFTTPCRTSCPIQQDIPAYLAAVDEGRYEDALNIIIERNALPFITGTICPHHCADKCTRNFYEESVRIRDVKLEAAKAAYADPMKHFKRAAALMLTLCALLALTACGSLQDKVESKLWETAAPALVQGNMDLLYKGACDETYLKLVNSTAEDCASYYDENMTLQAQAFMNVFDVNDLDGTQTDRFADIMKQVYAQAEYTVGAVSQVDDTHFLVDVTVTPLDFPKQVNGALYTGLMTFVNAYGDVTDEQLNAMTDEEYAKYEAAWASGIHNGCRIALNNGLNTLEPVTVQMAVSKADDGKWSIDDDSIVKFDQALMFYPESFE